MTDSIFTEDELAADALVETEAPEGVEPQVEAPARDEHGRFAPKQAEDTAAPTAEEGGDVEKPAGTVPQGALHAEREKRKGVEAELKTAREQLAAIQQLREQALARKPEPLPTPEDPAATDYLRQRIEEQGQQINRFSQERDLAAVEQAEYEQLGSLMSASENDYRQAQPDYDQAIDHVVQARARELALYGLQPAQIQQTIREEVIDIVRSAVAQNRNPAELGYQIALSRGYRPAQGGDAPAPQPVNGAAAARVAAIGAARAGSQSLGQAAGSTPQTLNADAIAAMSADEFDALYSTPEGKRMIDNL